MFEYLDSLSFQTVFNIGIFLLVALLFWMSLSNRDSNEVDHALMKFRLDDIEDKLPPQPPLDHHHV